jgi:hypothetical protein
MRIQIRQVQAGKAAALSMLSAFLLVTALALSLQA